MSKPSFRDITIKELRRYVLAHRDDLETWHEFAAHPRLNPVIVQADKTLEEQERIVKEMIEHR